MIRKLLTNTLARKASIFAVVFVVAVVSMAVSTPGSHGNMSAMDDLASTLALRGETGTQEQALFAPDTEPPLTAYPNEAPLELATWTPDVMAQTGEDESGEGAPGTEPAVFAYKPTAGWLETSEDFCYLSELPLSEELQRYTYARCVERGVDYTLVLALMWRESNFQTQVVGYNDNGTKDSGIMQINDVNREWLHRELAIDNLLDPYQNIDAGTEILGRFAEKYGQHDALLAYQYGETGMRRKLEEGIATNSQIEGLYRKKAEFDQMLVSEED